MLPACKNLIAEARQSIQEISWEALEALGDHQGVLIDIREPDEFNNGSLSGAINIPRGWLEFKIQACPELESLNADELLNTPIFLFCSAGGRSALAAQSLQKLGFSRVCSVRGGLELKP